MTSYLQGSRGPKVVALGGGHGLYASLSALKHLTRNITAIVTVADDGGSSGRLRQEFDVLPPGDLRMALSALCNDDEWGQTWRDVLQYRFSSQGDLDRHSLGNLLITGIWDLLGDDIAGLDLVGRLLNIKGKVIPMASVPLAIEADTYTSQGVETIYGQHRIATANVPIAQVRITPSAPPVPEQALQAIMEADWVIFGPGSWFTSVLPHLIVPDLHTALAATQARRLLVFNLAADSETPLMRNIDFLHSFMNYAPDIRLDAALLDLQAVGVEQEFFALAQQCGLQVLQRNIVDPKNLLCHDPLYLAAAYRELFVQSQ